MSSIETSNFKVIKRDSKVVMFERNKIETAISKAFIAVNGTLSQNTHIVISNITDSVVKSLCDKHQGGIFHIEHIQDEVEIFLMKAGEHEVAKAYILYRNQQNELRKNIKHPIEFTLKVKQNDNIECVSTLELKQIIQRACKNYEDNTDVNEILELVLRDSYEGMTNKELDRCLYSNAQTLIEKEPAYNYVSARLLLNTLYKEVLNVTITERNIDTIYRQYFIDSIPKAVTTGKLNKALLEFDLEKLSKALLIENDYKFGYIGLQTLYDRYFIHENKVRIELPQTFFMRVAMGLAIEEENKTETAIEFYNILSSFRFMCSTPTLFNSGTNFSQLSSCFISTTEDDLKNIFETISDNALLQKYAGGVGNDWTSVRALGSHIKSTNGESQGVIPFLKIVNDTAIAVNQGGKRKGAVCSYLETWHLDIEEFLDLRKNTGDDRRRTHDMNTANWIPDLFMKRVILKQNWTLFSPSDVPDLHDLYGKKFEERYVHYEEQALLGKIKLYKTLPAEQLWRKMLSMLFETGHPWITFKDACNIRSPQKHVGVIHSSNLCTEITLNTSKTEIAVCNLGSINLYEHISSTGEILKEKLKETITIAIRMLDNVININFYAVDKARDSNLRHRPIGLGIMGFQDCLYVKKISYASSEAVNFADSLMELISYYAFSASNELAKTRGAYSTFKGSLWEQGILPLDSLKLLSEERGFTNSFDFYHYNKDRLNWETLRNDIQKHGLRNSNVLAIAPTSAIANIVGVTSSIEPTYQNLFVKSNLAGEFLAINEFLVNDLKSLGLWNKAMIDDLKFYDGSLQHIDRIPQRLKELYLTAFEISSSWLILCAARRQKWIDQAQSLNLYIKGASGKELDVTYKYAWSSGLKTTYYLKTLAASSVEKSTLDRNQLNAVKACSIDNAECESCQ